MKNKILPQLSSYKNRESLNQSKMVKTLKESTKYIQYMMRDEKIQHHYWKDVEPEKWRSN